MIEDRNWNELEFDYASAFNLQRLNETTSELKKKKIKRFGNYASLIRFYGYFLKFFGTAEPKILSKEAIAERLNTINKA